MDCRAVTHTTHRGFGWQIVDNLLITYDCLALPPLWNLGPPDLTNMNSLLEALRSASANDRDIYRPLFFRTSSTAETAALEELLKREPVTVLDHLHGQLTELVRSLHPSIKFTPQDLDRMAVQHLAGVPSEQYGVWVYYPWNRQLVHLLDEEEFALVRTDRNRNKITRDEQALLATRKVGVIGLSVGQSASLTMAQERSFGELRLADFDTLELSNLNRIRSGVHELGRSKVVNTAREIAEIDPFLKVVCFPEGITADNLDRFLTEGGNLDLLVEECDSVAVKIQARQKAKALRIPVVIDVERFDLEPDRPILHGLVDHLDLSLAAKAKTNEEKLPFVIPIIGLDTMSVRMKASMLEIENTVTTWPQLGSAVVLGGALVAEVHRRIALGQFTSSGRWFIDGEELIGGPTRADGHLNSTPSEPLTSQGMAELAAQCEGEHSTPIDPEQARALVDAAILAPSAGNLQPWRFLLDRGRLFVFHDGERGDSALDSGRLIPAVDVGTCLENIQLKAAELGLATIIRAYPVPTDHRLAASILLAERTIPKDDPLASWIGSRTTNRKKGDGRPLPRALMTGIETAVAAVNGCAVHFATDRAQMDRIGLAIAAAERVRVLNPIGHFELFRKEMRWSTKDAERTQDGLDLATMELKLTEEVGFRVAADRRAMDLLQQWDTGQAFQKLTRESIASASALMLITSAKADRASLLEAGRAVQRAWLAATQANLSVHPCSAPILLAHHIRHGNSAGFSKRECDEVMRCYTDLVQEFGIGEQEPIFLLRLSFGGSPTSRSLRRPIEAFFHTHQSLPA